MVVVAPGGAGRDSWGGAWLGNLLIEILLPSRCDSGGGGEPAGEGAGAVDGTES